jgi:hypothetical protein
MIGASATAIVQDLAPGAPAAQGRVADASGRPSTAP